jgi:hypothetical protein
MSDHRVDEAEAACRGGTDRLAGEGHAQRALAADEARLPAGAMPEPASRGTS